MIFVIVFLQSLLVIGQDLNIWADRLSNFGFEDIYLFPKELKDDTIRFVIALENSSLNNPNEVVGLVQYLAKCYVFNKIVFVLQKKVPLFQGKTNILVETVVLVSRSGSLSIPLAILSTNYLEAKESGDGMRPPYFAYTNQVIPRYYLSVFSRLFFDNGHGFDFQDRFYPFVSSLGIGCNFSDTSIYGFTKKYILFSEINQQLLSDFEYPLEIINFNALIQVDRFLDQQLGRYTQISEQV